MAWTRFSEFNTGGKENVYLFLERGRPWTTVIVCAGLVGLMLLLSNWAVDPDWHPGRARGRGAWVIALLVLMPIAVRVVVLGLLTGLVVEVSYRAIWRSYDGMPDYVIGPAGIADLNPWNPRALLWSEIHEIRRWVSRPRLWGAGTFLYLQFVARCSPPRLLPRWLWHALPEGVRERSIMLAPQAVGSTERGVMWLIERFGGRIAIVERRAAT